MNDEFAEDVYDTLCGELIPEAAVPGVENAFAPGMPCEERYGEMLQAYARLLDRLGVADEDADVEIIINALLDNTRELCLRMFACGAAFAQK